MSELDLKPFCCTEECRPYIQQPFTRGEYTYATDGHIAVRVAAREGLADAPQVPKIAEMFTEHLAASYVPLPAVKLPEPDGNVLCAECEGGLVSYHDCPHCNCTCDRCDGTGLEPPLLNLSIGLGDGIYAGRYYAMLRALPNIQIGPTSKEKPLAFQFDGGAGLLMPMRATHATHINATVAGAA